ncbi:MAG: HEAT repeat domain-containing protein [Myxococcota bacterium]
MTAPSELFWRLLGNVRPRERSRFLFFAGLSTLVSLAQTLGLAGSEALFLARFGVSVLPETFILASLVTVVGSLAYATRVGSARNDSLFAQMLLGCGLALGGAAFAVASGSTWVVLALVCFFYLTQAVFVNHFWTFAGDYFDTVTSRRLFPLFTIGASLGGLLGGTLTLLVVRLTGAAGLILGWGALLLCAALMLRLGRRRLRRWGPLELEEADETSVESMRGAVRYLRASSLGRWLALSVLAMMLALFVAQYLYSDLFARRYPDSADDLAVFFGIYLAATNAIEILVEAKITQAVIRRWGVATANLIHPVLTLASFAGLAFRYGFVSGMAARANRELMENSLAGPLRSLVYNAMPQRFRGRTRAFLEGMVVYAAMALAGLVVLVLGRPEPPVLCAAGAAISVLYLGANLRTRRAYLEEIVAQLRAGRFDPAELGGELGGWEASRLGELFAQLLPRESGRPSRSLLDLIPLLAERGIARPLIRAASHPSAEVRRVVVKSLAGARDLENRRVFERALGDSDAGVRLAALRGLARPGGDSASFAPLLEDPDPRVRAEAASRAGPEGLAILEHMLHSPVTADAVAALALAPASLLPAVRARTGDSDAAVRAAVLECITRVAAAPLGADEIQPLLRDPDVRVRRAALQLLAVGNDRAARRALADALADPAPAVRSAAVAALDGASDDDLDLVAPHLRSDGVQAIEALRVMAGAGSRRRELLSIELRHHAEELWRDIAAYRLLPAGADLDARSLRVAHEDSMGRHVRLAFLILGLLEDPAVIRKVERALRLGTERARGNALEVISNLGDRAAASLLELALDKGPVTDRLPEAARLVALPADTDEVLDRSRRSSGRWMRKAQRVFEADREEALEMERILALKQVPLLANLSLDHLEAISQVARELEFLPGEVILREGEQGDELYLMIQGEVRILKDFATPNERLLRTQSGVGYFGEMGALAEAPRTATIVATRRSTLLCLDGASFRELIHQMPEISFEIFRVLIARLRDAER